MLEIVFLGTGSGIPSKKRNHSAIWLRYEGDSFLWDCGEGTQRQLLYARLNFMKIGRIFITHWHADHWAGLIGLIQTMNLEKRRKPLYIYGPDAERFVSDILDLDYWGPRFKIISVEVPYEGDEIETIYHTKDFEIKSTPVKHTVPAVAYCFKERDRINVDLSKAKRFGLRQGPLIGKLKIKGKITFRGREVSLEDVAVVRKGTKVVYSGDTKSCETLAELARDADVLIHDATFMDERENRMHTGAGEAARVAKKVGVKKLVLTHFSRRYIDPKPLEDEAKKEFKNTIIAKDFLKLKLKHK